MNGGSGNGSNRGQQPPAVISPDPRNSIAHRFGRVADRFRQREQIYGLRSTIVSLVWSKWTGKERGEGVELVMRAMELAPRPLVQDGAAATNTQRSGGIMPDGTVKLEQISPYYPTDILIGLAMPCDPAAYRAALLRGERPGDIALQMANAFAIEEIPQPYDFWWELVDDGRSDPRPMVKQRYRVQSGPIRRPDKLDWTITLERVGEDRTRHGKTRPGPDDGVF